MLFNIIMSSCYTILVGCRHLGVGSDLSAIASAMELRVEKNQSVPEGHFQSILVIQQKLITELLVYMLFFSIIDTIASADFESAILPC